MLKSSFNKIADREPATLLKEHRSADVLESFETYQNNHLVENQHTTVSGL